MNKQHGFTLIELLIVVAIIGILASIAVPNFLQAQIKAKTARVVSDMRTISTGLEMYRLDRNAYPSWNNTLAGANVGFPNAVRYYRLTTPIAYLSTIPQDPFVNVQNQEDYSKFGTAYEYVDDKTGTFAWGHAYRINSWGPDAKNSSAGYREFNNASTGCPKGSPLFVYDPSNGVASYGDIVWVGNKVSNNNYCNIRNGF